MKNIFSISLIVNKLDLLARRFPVSILLVFGFAALLFTEINCTKCDIPYQFFIFCSSGAVMGVTAVLRLEDFVNYLKQCIITAAVVLLWGVYCYFLPKDIQTDKIVELVVIGAAAVFSLFFISFLRKNKDKAFWNFTIQTLFQFCLAILFSGIIYGGLALAVLAIENLFKITFHYKIYGNLAIFCFALIAPLYFMANIPDKIAKHSEEISLNKFLKVLTLYILIPIVAIFALILYFYLFKIILAWELPNRSVAWVVSILAGGGLLIITLLYPLRLEGKNRFIVVLSRYFGLLLLPLLVLMTIGVFRRIGDYGITIRRCYILLLNIWFYGIYAYIFITKSQRIKWILISPTVIFLLLSVGFWSLPNITKHTIKAELNNYLNNKQIDISDTTFFDNMEQKDKEKIGDKLNYLCDNYGKESVQQFFSDSIPFDKSIYGICYDLFRLNDDERVSFFSYSMDENTVWDVKQFNYNTFIPIKYIYYKKDYGKEVDYSYENGQFIIKTISDNRVFSIPLKNMAIEYIKDKAQTISCEEKDDYTVLISFYNGYYYETKDSVSIESFEGYLFYNK